MESTKTGEKKIREQHRGRDQSFRKQPRLLLSRVARAAAPASQATVVVSQALSFSSPRFIHKLNATVKASRTLMRAAIFSSYGNGTRLDRFIPVSTALLKKKKSSSTVCMHACMHAGTCVDRRVESISSRSTFLSSSVVSAFFLL